MRTWTYHVPVPPEARRIEYVDVKMDQGAFDYDALLGQWERSVRRYGATPTICTWTENAAEPMYQRVKAMLACVEGDLFNAIVFLDSDAFLNAYIDGIFAGDWDIGVTYRHNMGMALNEGVIFVNNRRPDAVRSFFRAYLAAYDRLIADPAVQAKYGNIKRWRGGQLSLNAIANPLGLPNALDRIECHGAMVAYFPCWKWNFPADRVDKAELDTKAIVHLKGGRKHLLDAFIKYQEGK